MREFSSQILDNQPEIECIIQVGCHKKAMGITHAHILVGNLNGESHACADSRRFFVATDLKTPVAI